MRGTSERWGERGAAPTVAARWCCAMLAAFSAVFVSGCSDGERDLAGSTTQRAVVRSVIPVITAAMKTRLRTVYLNGQTLGNRAQAFSKVGDSFTASGAFLTDIGCSAENLGTHTELAPTISYFRGLTIAGRSNAWCGVSNSFSLNSIAAGSSWTTTSALAAITRTGCASPYNTRLKCELRLTRPSIALVMLGTYDLQSSATTTTYTTNLTRVVTDSIGMGVIPVLSTIPPRTDNATYGARVAAYNDAVLAVAAAQQVPVWDYWLAMTAPGMVTQGLSTNGLDPSQYLNAYPVTFTAPGLTYGYNQRNYTALQVLAHIKAVVIDNGPADPEPGTDAGTDAATDASDAATDVATDRTDASLDAATDATDAATDATDAATDTTDAATDASLDAATDTSLDSTADGGVDGGTTRPIVPLIGSSMKARLRTVYTTGLTLGNRAAVFSKVGDGLTATQSFLSDIGCSAENLGTHTELAPTISYFRGLTIPGRTSSSCGVSNSFSLDSVAASGGWTTSSALAGVTRSDCPAPYDTMLKCEYHLTRPSVSLVLIGTNDLELINNITDFTTNLTRIVTDSVSAGVIPVLSTLPPRTDNATLTARIPAYNDAIYAVGAAQQVPVWNYWQAMTAPTMVNQGLDGDGLHPNVYLGSAPANFTDPGLTYGYNQRNFTAVQVLAKIKSIVIDDGAPDYQDPDAGTDAGADVAIDTVVDTGVDSAIDSTVDATIDSTIDSTIDAAVDAATDTATDTRTDTGTDTGTDAAVDVVPDAAWDAGPGCNVPLIPAANAAGYAALRQSCTFTAGARVADTLGVTAAVRSQIPIDHVVIIMQENHSFDQYLGTMPGDVDRIPAGYTNPNLANVNVSPTRLTQVCTTDPPHQWDAMHAGWNNGLMNGFARTGEEANILPSVMLGYYTEAEIPFYRWLYNNFAMSDRYFCSVLSGTWATRDFAYMGSSYGVRNTNDLTVTNKTTIFDLLDAANITWGVYTDGGVRQNCLGWTNSHRNVYGVSTFYSQLAAGTLPSVVYLDAIDDATDEHPPTNIHLGETFVRNAVLGVMASPLWMRMALLITYDESGGFFDHVAPPSACYPHAPANAGYDTTDLNRLGIRVPFVAVSPWARSHFVSHVVHDHGSMLRFIETIFDLPALTGRDANASALLDLFDFSCAQSATVSGTIPAAGTTTTGCP